MTALWAVGGYAVGTIPSAWLVARLSGGHRVIEESRRDRGEADAHIVIGRRVGAAWATVAAVADVAKGLGWVLLARHVGNLPPAWLAVTGAAVVAGHAFPVYLREMSGRGLAAAAGVFLALLPIPMIVAGLTMCVGFLVRQSGLMSTVGFALVPVVAWWQREPSAFVAMGAAVFVLILIRRLEGVGDAAREHRLSRGRAAMYRVLFDASGPPETRAAAGSTSDESPP